MYRVILFLSYILQSVQLTGRHYSHDVAIYFSHIILYNYLYFEYHSIISMIVRRKKTCDECSGNRKYRQANYYSSR